MTPEDELKLSFYEEISTVKQSHNISLVKRIDTGEIFIKKTLFKEFLLFMNESWIRTPEKQLLLKNTLTADL